MGALLAEYAAQGVGIEATNDGKLRACGRLTDALRASIRANKPALLAELAANDHGIREQSAQTPARTWRVQYPNGTAMDVLFTPEASADEVCEVYPGAAIEAKAEARKRLPTPAEAEELRTLIAQVLRSEAEAERTDALTVACSDPEAAVLSLRTLRDELRLNEKWLGRRYVLNNDERDKRE